ncbi:hypothetical protein Cgig2_023853 [Carnegiea gigantea]|uniref:Uncharacterized protein n=1 Tax=Carnegiea gigantea TaxID=171969 RepID=A0A9Q1GGU9_9CARY|nr:hypothetical protein Cgig2_023853 [Carnegiea gigantea]
MRPEEQRSHPSLMADIPQPAYFDLSSTMVAPTSTSSAMAEPSNLTSHNVIAQATSPISMPMLHCPSLPPPLPTLPELLAMELPQPRYPFYFNNYHQFYNSHPSLPLNQPPLSQDFILHQSRFCNSQYKHGMVCVLELKRVLTNIKKGDDQTMDAYLQKIKTITDNLATVNSPIASSDLVHYTLLGLG